MKSVRWKNRTWRWASAVETCKEEWNTTILRGGSTGEKDNFSCEKYSSLQADFSDYFFGKTRLQKQQKRKSDLGRHDATKTKWDGVNLRNSRVVKFRGLKPISEIGFSRRTDASDQGLFPWARGEKKNEANVNYEMIAIGWTNFFVFYRKPTSEIDFGQCRDITYDLNGE